MIEDVKLRGEYFEQLALNLEIEEVEVGNMVTPEEAQRRSELARQTMEIRFGEKVKRGEDEVPLIPWREDYEMIVAAKWPWRVAAYIAWASSPRKNRWPKTQEDLAIQVLGLTSDRQITTWRKKNEAIDEMISLLQSAPLLKHRRDIYEALAESASRVDHRSNPDRKLALEVMGDYVPHAKIDLRRGKVDDLSDLTDEELEKISKRASGK